MSQGWQPLALLTWINKPNTSTPLNQTNLNNQIKNNVSELDSRTRTLDTIKLDITNANSLVQNVTFDSTTGIFTITKYNGSSTQIDTKLEKIAINFHYDDDPTSPHYQELVIELDDGTYQYIDMSTLITEYEFDNTSTIGFTVTSGVVTADVLDGSITAAKLDPDYLADCLAAVADAQAAETSAQKWADGTGAVSGDPQYQNSAKYHADQADASRLESEGWAVGEANGVPITDPTSPYYHNNAKWYKDQAQQIAGGSIGGLSDVTITNLQDGQTIVSNNGDFENVDFAFSELKDVDYGTPTDGQVPYYDSNSGKLKFKTVSATFGGLTDVNFTSLQNGQIPIYDAANQKWVNGDMTRIVPIPVPTSTTYTYDGTAQDFAFDSIDTSLVNVTGGTQTNAGTYTVTCSLKGAYDYWTDLTSAPKTFTWTIAKAQGSITLASSTATVTPLITSVNVGLTVVGDGTVTATSSDTSVVTSSIVGSNVEIDGVYKGSATITVTLADSTNYIGDSDTITVASTYIALKTFAAATDQEIADMVEAADLGYIDLYDDAGWRVGMEHSVSLSAIAASGTYDGVSWTVGEAQSAQTATLVLLHQGLYELVTSVLDKQGQTRNTCSFIYGTKDVLATHGKMNNTSSTSGSWSASSRRAWCNGGFREAMPSALRGASKQFKVVTGDYSGGSQTGGTNIVTNDYFTLAAEKEIYGLATYSTTNEANALTQLEWYETTANIIKYLNGSATYYFDRSPSYDDSARYCLVGSSGNASKYNAAYDAGIAPIGVF